MASKYQAPRGTFDVLPQQARSRARVERTATRILARAGYEPIATPAFEDTELFVRGVGRSTDIVNKEMFSFEDKGGRSITLRPEGTAPTCRAYLAHGMHKLAQPVKLFYHGSFFRHERPQAGRYRQFHQIGAEAIGGGSPMIDVELIVMLSELFSRLGIPGVELRLGSLGSFETRQDYRERLIGYLRRNADALSDEVRQRIDLNPLRAFDSDHKGTRRVMKSAPRLIDNLTDEDAQHFNEVCDLLREAEVSYRIDPTLVRGLDYYTRTVFSFVCPALGAQSELGGGGRYDGLIEQMGGSPTPAAGWAVGVERILLAWGHRSIRSRRRVVFIAVADSDRRRAFWLAMKLRREDITTQIDLGGRSLKGQLRHADRIGADLVMTLEGAGAWLRDRKRGKGHEVDLGHLEDDPETFAALVRLLKEWWTA